MKDFIDFGKALVGLGSEFIEDPDKRLEFQVKAQLIEAQVKAKELDFQYQIRALNQKNEELKAQIKIAALQSKTSVFADSIYKLMPVIRLIGYPCFLLAMKHMQPDMEWTEIFGVAAMVGIADGATVVGVKNRDKLPKIGGIK